MSEYILYLSFWVWVTSLNMFFSRFIYLPANFNMSIVKMYHLFFIHSSAEGLLGYFQVLATMNNVAMNMVEHMSLWYH